MIPLHHIEYWSAQVPWVSNEQIEQDLIISRALIELYQSEFLRKTMIFRGGTALNKLFFNPPQRYSEDLDFVDITGNGINAQITHIEEAINSWLDKPTREEDKENGLVRLTYTFNTTISNVPRKLKIEVNTVENFYVYKPIMHNYSISSNWIQKQAIVPVYCLEELLATKLRALYQRRKSRDLFDLDTALAMYPDLDINKLINAFHIYTGNNGKRISRDDFTNNLYRKMQKKSFREDILPFLPQNKRQVYSAKDAHERICLKILSYL